jgi:hypothetical protein
MMSEQGLFPLRRHERTLEQRAELMAWCGKVSEDVCKRLDETWPNDVLLTRCATAFGRLFAEIDRLEREKRTGPERRDVDD